MSVVAAEHSKLIPSASAQDQRDGAAVCGSLKGISSFRVLPKCPSDAIGHLPDRAGTAEFLQCLQSWVEHLMIWWYRHSLSLLSSACYFLRMHNGADHAWL